MIPVLTREIEDLTGYHIPEGSFRPDLVASYLRNTVRIVDAQGKTLAASKDLDDLFERFGQRAKEVWKAQAPARGLERTGLAECEPQVFGEVLRHLLHSLGVVLDGRYGVERIEQEVRVDLCLQLPQFVLLGQRHGLESAIRGGTRGRFGPHLGHLRLAEVVDGVKPEVDSAPHAGRDQPWHERHDRTGARLALPAHEPVAQNRKRARRGDEHHDPDESPSLRPRPLLQRWQPGESVREA
jgi:hypothetical protein